MSCKCQECGRPYKVDLIVSNQLWEKIKPNNKQKGAGLLCPTCIVEKLEKMHTYSIWELTLMYNHKEVIKSIKEILE